MKQRWNAAEGASSLRFRSNLPAHLRRMNLKKSGVGPNSCGFQCLHPHHAYNSTVLPTKTICLLVNDVLAATLTQFPNYLRYRSGAGNVSTNSAPGSCRRISSLPPSCEANALTKRIPKPLLEFGAKSGGKPIPSALTPRRGVRPLATGHNESCFQAWGVSHPSAKSL